jgi:hypothetical protein
MRNSWWGGVLVAVGLLPAANAQFTLTAIVDNLERQVLSVYDLGTVSAGDPAAARFRLRNSSNAPATLTLLAVAGAGFSLASAPSLPMSLNAQTTVDFAVSFRATDTGSYSAVLRSDGISVLLTMAVVPSLSYAVETAVGKQALGAAPVDLGEVELGQSSLLHFDIENRSIQALTVPAIAVGTGDFALSGVAPGGKLLQPGETTGFDVQFRPSEAGARSGVLTINSRGYTLAGTGITPPLPKPRIRIDLPQAASAQQGSVTVNLDGPARSSGSGTLTLDLEAASPGAADAAIAFASGGRTASFAFQPGDSQGRFGGQTAALFQTGTTAGTLTVTAQLGGATDRQTVTIAPAPVGLSAADATKSAGSIEIRITGYDNTRTAGQLSFTFFDVGGNIIAPGTIRGDGAAAFSRFFQGSDLGGTFLLRALFPVTGDSSAVASFSAEITNSAGTAVTAKARF